MSRDKKPRSKSSGSYPLENPHIANKLAKLQFVHEHTEKLIDRWSQESLKAGRKKPTGVRAKARKPGPRTDSLKRCQIASEVAQ
jgi:hypothetical protein